MARDAGQEGQGEALDKRFDESERERTLNHPLS